MIVRLYMGNAYVDVRKLHEVDCPNKYGGIGNVTVEPYEIWGGSVHFLANRVSFSFGAVTKIETRSDDSESDEPWRRRWTRSEPFTYAQYFEASRILKKLKGKRDAKKEEKV